MMCVAVSLLGMSIPQVAPCGQRLMALWLSKVMGVDSSGRAAVILRTTTVAQRYKSDRKLLPVTAANNSYNNTAVRLVGVLTTI